MRIRKKKMIKPFKRRKISANHKIKKYAVLILGVASALFVMGVFIYGIGDEHIREKLLLFFVIFMPVVILIWLVTVLIDYWKMTKSK